MPGRCPRAGSSAPSLLKVSASAIQDLPYLLWHGCVNPVPVRVAICAGHARDCCLERLKAELRMTLKVTKPSCWINKKFLLSHSPEVAAEYDSPFQTCMHINWHKFSGKADDGSCLECLEVHE